MDTLFLSRLQFALTIAFHYIFPPISIGLGLILVIMEGQYLKTKNVFYHQMTRFWVTIFGLIFALGVASGIVMEFQFGTNWAQYSRFVGDVFGSALAAEGIFAFFLESGFLAILLFGWNKVSPRVHFLSTIMVAVGAHFSAVWIIVANSWQQTPTGHHIVKTAQGFRAEIVDFWQVVFNPSTLDRLSHTVSAAWLSGAFLIISVSAFYLVKNKHIEFAKKSMQIGLVIAAIASMIQLFTGHSSGVTVAETQPAKLAAFEGHYEENAPADLYLFGWVDDENETVVGVKLPGMLSFLIYGDSKRPVTGLNAFEKKDRPPVQIVFQAYHLMVTIGFCLILLSFTGILMWWRGTLFQTRWMLWIMTFSVLLPQIGNQIGWIAAEVGRQPWIVYNLLRTSEAVSPNVSPGQVMFSIILFGFIYLLLFVLFIYLLNEKIQKGPSDKHLIEEGHRA